MKLNPRHFIRLIIYLPIVLLVLLALAVGTPIGSQLSVSVLQAFVPDISVDYKSGTLNKSLSVTNLNINYGNLRIKADRIDLSWNPLCFINSQLCINELKAKNAVVNIITGKSDAKRKKSIVSEPAASFSLPFSVIAKKTRFDSIEIHVDQQSYTSTKLEIDGDWDNNGLKLNNVISYGFAMDGVWNAKREKTGKLSGNKSKSISLPPVNLPFRIFITNARLFNTDLALDDMPFKFKTIEINNTSWVDTRLSMNRIKFRHAGLICELNGELDFKDAYPIDLQAKVLLQDRDNLFNTPLSAIKQLRQLNQQSLKLIFSRDFDELHLKGTAEGQINSTLSANIRLLRSGMPFNAQINKLTGEWHLKKGKVTAKDLDLAANGTIKNVKLTARGKVSSPYIPNLSINGQANLNQRGISNTTLTANSPNGSMKLTGEFNWAPNLNWRLKADFTKLKANQFGDDDLQKLPSAIIDGHLNSTASFKKTQWSFNIFNSDLSGAFKGRPFKITGSIKADSEYNIDAEHFNADILGTSVKLDSNQQTGKLSGTLRNDNLASLFPKISGELTTIFTLSKDAQQQPEIIHKTEISRLRYAGVHVQEVKLSGTYRPLSSHYNETSLKAQNASLYGLLFKAINLNVKGTDKKQVWSIQTRSKVNLISKLTSEVTDRFVRVSIPELAIRNKQSNWSADQTINLKWDRKSELGTVNEFCIHNGAQYFCSEDSAVFGKNGKIDLSYNGNLNEVAHPFLPPRLAIYGNLNAHSELRWKNYTKPDAKVTITLGSGKLLLYPHRNIPKAFPYQSLNLNASLDDRQLHIVSSLKADNYAHWDSDISVSIDPGRQLSGYIDFSDIQLAPIAEFFPMFNTLTGSVNSKLNLKGNLNDPAIKGHVSLNNGEVAFIKNPTKFHNIKLDLGLDNKRASVNADWDMDKGKAKLVGNADWSDGLLKGELNIKGKNLTAIEPPLAILTVEPDVNIKISDRNITLDGNVNVTGGNITITPLPKQGIPLSSDVVFVDKQQHNIPEPTIYLTSNININVSDKLAINGMGLSGNLGGKLSMSQSSGSQPLLFGDIKIQNGNYRFLGQTLNIQKGSLEFVGPSENPALDIEAVKDINQEQEDITVGVKVSGTAKHPKISLFSNPALEQAEIVSYLLQGHGFNSNSSDDDQQNNNNALFLSAALTLGAKAGVHNPFATVGNSAENLAAKLGLSNVHLNANDDGKLAISGFIGDRLLLKYGYGVFDPGYELTVRYYLLSKLYLESVSSALGQSLDLYYRFDIGKNK